MNRNRAEGRRQVRQDNRVNTIRHAVHFSHSTTKNERKVYLPGRAKLLIQLRQQTTTTTTLLKANEIH